jgi:DNA-directed RNA polymerase specialized sigma24 family protein
LPEHPGQASRPARRAQSRRVVGSALGASWGALEGFHRDYFLPLVWRATYRHGLTKEDAKDVVQEAFVLAMTKLRPDGNPRAWLNQVVDNLCANHQRKELRRAHLAARWGLAEGALRPELILEDEVE